eukprot:TRINITY_DN36635_c0_g1_i1.p4 TRINITY_DN36635_c0_g1~~TRINITY_DN36635_c0_g1_i1.p4  ORF type:complete len:102 (+),score=24.23 TRINITY_DN36635_c0_g1_i1:158-463(+)
MWADEVRSRWCCACATLVARDRTAHDEGAAHQRALTLLPGGGEEFRGFAPPPPRTIVIQPLPRGAEARHQAERRMRRRGRKASAAPGAEQAGAEEQSGNAG